MASKIKVDQIEGSTGSTITIPTGQTFTVTDGIPVASGGTGLASFTAGDILYATGATTLAKLTKGTAEQVLAMNAGATAPDWGSVDLTVLPTISVAKGGTGQAGGFTQGDFLYATDATTLAKLAKGTASQTLKMNAGATAPEWVTASAGGAWTKIKAQAASADSSIDFLNGTDDVVYDDTYDLYMVTIVGLRPAADDYLSLRYYIDGTWRTDSYYRYGLSRPTTGDWTWQYSNSSANSLIELGNADGGAVGESGNRRCYFYQPASTVNKPQMEWAGCKANSSGVLGHYNGAGWYAGTGAEAEACTGIRFYFPSNNIAVGNFVLYGLTK